MAVPIKIGATFEPGVASPLFEARLVAGFFTYDVTAEDRFLTLTPVADLTLAPSPVTIVLNWQAGLRTR